MCRMRWNPIAILLFPIDIVIGESIEFKWETSCSIHIIVAGRDIHHPRWLDLVSLVGWTLRYGLDGRNDARMGRPHAYLGFWRRYLLFHGFTWHSFWRNCNCHVGNAVFEPESASVVGSTDNRLFCDKRTELYGWSGHRVNPRNYRWRISNIVEALKRDNESRRVNVRDEAASRIR